MKHRDVPLVLSIVLLSVACAAPAQNAAAPRDDKISVRRDGDSLARINVEVIVEPTGLSIQTDSECDEGGEIIENCVEIGEPNYAEFVFELFDEDGDDSQNWQFNRLVICRSGEKDIMGCRLTKLQRLEFVATLPGRRAMALPNGKGIVELERKQNLQSFQLWNMNNLRREFEYGLAVCPVGFTIPQPPDTDWGDCRVVDPKIKNLGRRLN